MNGGGWFGWARPKPKYLDDAAAQEFGREILLGLDATGVGAGEEFVLGPTSAWDEMNNAYRNAAMGRDMAESWAREMADAIDAYATAQEGPEEAVAYRAWQDLLKARHEGARPVEAQV